MPHRSLAEYVAFLRQAEIVPRPDGEEWKAMIARISVTGTIAAIDQETFFYFLEVLPPKFQQGSLFAFAEGAESLRIFWRQGGAHFCRALTLPKVIVGFPVSSVHENVIDSTCIHSFGPFR